MNGLLEEIYKTRRVEDSEGNLLNPFPFSIRREEGQALYRLIRATRPQRTLEIGLAYGLSTLFICQALQDNGQGRHTVVDPFERTTCRSVGLLNLRRAGLADRMAFHEVSSREFLPELLSRGERFDFIYVDGDHSRQAVAADFLSSDRLLLTGGRLFFDDIWVSAVQEVVSAALEGGRYEVVPEFSSRPAPPAMRALSRRPAFWRFLNRHPAWFSHPMVWGSYWTALRKVSDDADSSGPAR